MLKQNSDHDLFNIHPQKERTKELARLMQKGKIIVPGLHQVDGNYIRSDLDDSETNNMLEMFKSNEMREVVVKDK